MKAPLWKAVGTRLSGRSAENFTSEKDPSERFRPHWLRTAVNGALVFDCSDASSLFKALEHFEWPPPRGSVCEAVWRTHTLLEAGNSGLGTKS